MNEDTTLIEQVREIMATTFHIDESELPADASQEHYSRWTSLYHMTLIAALEEYFDVTFTMEEMTSMISIAQILEILKEHHVTPVS